MIEICSICQKTVVERNEQHNIVTAQTHTQCRSCGAIACETCATVEKCPVCGFNGKD